MSQKQTYKPRYGSFSYLVITFFIDNKEEELTIDDMVTKWPDVVRNSIHSILSTVVLQEILARGRNDDGEYVYKAGPNIEDVDICRPVEISSIEQSESRGVKHVFHVEHAVPIPNFRTHSRNGKWQSLFNALEMKGQSIVIADADFKKVRATAQKMKQKQKGAPPHYYIGQDDKGAWRVWRTA